MTGQITPYQYQMIRGIDFYKHTLGHLSQHENVTIRNEEIISIDEQADAVMVNTNAETYVADYLFKSYPEKLDKENNHFVWQHFKGWMIETETSKFDPAEAIFMDFRVEQEEDTRFFYVLPISDTKALIEFTVFSDTVSEPTFYDPFLRSYIAENLGIDNYKVEDEELGAIPMTTQEFNSTRTKRIIPIGTNGGSVKASSGYAFTRIQRNTSHLMTYILEDKIENYAPIKNRYGFYDRIKKLSPQTIFKFLDEEGSFLNDLKIFTAPPTLPFLKAFFEEIKS